METVATQPRYSKAATAIQRWRRRMIPSSCHRSAAIPLVNFYSTLTRSRNSLDGKNTVVNRGPTVARQAALWQRRCSRAWTSGGLKVTQGRGGVNSGLVAIQGGGGASPRRWFSNDRPVQRFEVAARGHSGEGDLSKIWTDVSALGGGDPAGSSSEADYGSGETLGREAVMVAETDSNSPWGRFRNGTKPAGRRIDFNTRTARSCCRIDPVRRAGSPEQQRRPSIRTRDLGAQKVPRFVICFSWFWLPREH